MMIELSRSGLRPVVAMMPITTTDSSPMKIDGVLSTLDTLSRRAAPGPSTATLSARASWPSSKNRPVNNRARAASNSPGLTATSGIWNSVWPSGSITGTDRASRPLVSTPLTVPAAVTPFSRVSRSSASHGIRLTVRLRPPKGENRVSGSTVTWVASSSSKRDTI